MTPERMISETRRAGAELGWEFDAISVGFPAPVIRGKVVCDPANLGPGWTKFDFQGAARKPIRLVNDAAMQALGSYDGGTMLFLGLGTGLGAALVVDGVVAPLELARLPYRDGEVEDYVGRRGLERYGGRKWRKHVERVDTLVFDQRLREFDLFVDDVDQVVHDAALATHDEVEVAQADIEVDHGRLVAAQREARRETGTGRGLAHAPFAGGHDDDLGHRLRSFRDQSFKGSTSNFSPSSLTCAGLAATSAGKAVSVVR